MTEGALDARVRTDTPSSLGDLGALAGGCGPPEHIATRCPGAPLATDDDGQPRVRPRRHASERGPGRRAPLAPRRTEGPEQRGNGCSTESQAARKPPLRENPNGESRRPHRRAAGWEDAFGRPLFRTSLSAPRLLPRQQDQLDSAVLLSTCRRLVGGGRSELGEARRDETLSWYLTLFLEKTHDVGRPRRRQLPVRGEARLGRRVHDPGAVRGPGDR